MNEKRGEPDGSSAQKAELIEESEVKNKMTTEKPKSARKTTAKQTKPSRTAMGEYIPPQGKEYLTQQAKPKAGPADYQLNTNLIFPTSPQYSIVGRAKPDKVFEFPGPDNYSTSQDVVWKRKTKALKSKGETRPYNIKPDAHLTCSIGAGGYLVCTGDTGRNATKTTIGAKQNVATGPPNSHVHPVDTHGFKTPGPDYQPTSDRPFAKTFGLKGRDEDPDTPGPGPGAYETKLEMGKSYSFGIQLNPKIDNSIPGPAKYNIATTMETPLAKSLSSKHKVIDSKIVPSPDTYDIQRYTSRGPRHSMTYRAFETEVSRQPGPGDYDPDKDSGQKRLPSFSCRRSCRPCYPDILSYPEFSLMKNPGPGTHRVDISKNDKPSHSFGKRIEPIPNAFPGPNHYQRRFPCHPNSARAPKYSMGKRLNRTGSNTSVGPGPAAYFPDKQKQTPSYSMSSRHTRSRGDATPAPNAYSVPSGQTRRGRGRAQSATLKGRPSPFVYSGFRNITSLASTL
eukprot:m.10214 g.10214  ORF g.10214 m.10214 type:complete len:508 (+) comp22030_c0_seq3:125-1648(+)